MSYSAERLLALVPSVVQHKCVFSLRALLEELGVAPECGLLQRVQVLLDALSQGGFALMPALDDGDLDTPRSVLLAVELADATAAEVETLIAQQEQEGIEFKSTFFVDLKKLAALPGLPPKEYRSVAVIHSCLKTIAAFMNCDGGTLLVGVADDGSLLGLANDHLLAEAENEDKWQLAVRSQIQGQFKDGKALNAYVNISFCSLADGYRIGVLKVLPRSSTVFLKPPGEEYSLFVRNGNRTDRLDITQAEDYFRGKWDKSNKA